jgi:hypothetical protein
VIPALLAVLAIVDAAFAGFRAAAGRNARIFKWTYYRDAVLLGAGAGACLVLVLALLTLLLLFSSGEPAARYGDLLVIGARMLWLFGTYALLVLGALLVYATARTDIRTLATVAILGPFTLLRPWVIVAATVFGVSAGTRFSAVVLTVLSSGAVLALGKGLDWWYGRLASAEWSAGES